MCFGVLSFVLLRKLWFEFRRWLYYSELKDINYEVKIFETEKVLAMIRVRLGPQQLAKPVSESSYFPLTYLSGLHTCSLPLKHHCPWLPFLSFPCRLLCFTLLERGHIRIFCFFYILCSCCLSWVAAIFVLIKSILIAALLSKRLSVCFLFQMNYARFYYAEYFPDLHGNVVHIDNDCIVQGERSIRGLGFGRLICFDITISVWLL